MALTLFRLIDDRSRIGYMLGNLGLIACFQKQYERAVRLLEEAVEIGRELGDVNSVVIWLGNLGLVAFARLDYARAANIQREVLIVWREMGNQPHLARSFESIALIAAATHRPERAARLFGVAAALRTRLGAPLQPNDRDFNDRYIADIRTELGDRAFGAAWERGATLDLDAVIEDALDIDVESAPTFRVAGMPSDAHADQDA